MIRVAAWIVGLFAVGIGVSRLFPSPLVEPLVLIALGATMVFVANRGARAQEEVAQAAEAEVETPSLELLEPAPAQRAG